MDNRNLRAPSTDITETQFEGYKKNKSVTEKEIGRKRKKKERKETAKSLQ